jgi:RND family efflux transporter MFP subunit
MRVDEMDARMGGGRPDDAAPSRRWAGAVARGGRGSVLLKVVSLVALVGAGVWAWHANVTGKPAMDMSMRMTGAGSAFPVVVATAERGPIAGSVTYTGSVVPYVEEDVFPRVTGRIVSMPVYPGDAVKEGQVVARLDDVELGSRVQEAQAGAVAAAANVAQMEADVTAARHGVTQMEREVRMAGAEIAAAKAGVTQMERELAMIEAEAEHQEHLIVRDEKLYRSGAISLQDLEATRAAVAGARAKVQGAQAKIGQMRAMVVASEAKADAASAKLEQAHAMEASAVRKRDAMAAMAGQSRAMQRTAEVVRDYVNIRTPSGGYVVKRLVSPGVLVQPGMAILKIAQIDRVRLQANVGERDLGSIKVGSTVRVTTTAREAEPLSARVTSVFPFVDQGGRTGVVEAVVDNTGRRFLPGQYVTMEFVTGERADAVSVPRSAVARLGTTSRVWVVNDGTAEPREVTTGFASADRVEITRGLDGGERVVATGHEGLYARAQVAEVKRSRPAAGGAPTAPGRGNAATVPAAGHGDHGSAAAAQPAETKASDGGHTGHGTPAKKESGKGAHSGH